LPPPLPPLPGSLAMAFGTGTDASGYVASSVDCTPAYFQSNLNMPMPVPQSQTYPDGCQMQTSHWERCIQAEFQKNQTVAQANAGCGGSPHHTLRNYLEEACHEDASCVFLVRHIHRLGFHSAKILRDHFSHYGQVVRVLVAHKKGNGLADNQEQSKDRPGSLGFIIMKRPGSVRKVMATGKDHTVDGQKIRIEMFEPSKLSNGSSTDDAATAGSAVSQADDSSMPSNSLSEWSKSSQHLSSSDSGIEVNRWSRQSSVNDGSMPTTQVFMPVRGERRF